MNDSPLVLLEKAIEQNLNADFRHVQLATVDTDGHPACRTIVFRHLDAAGNRIFFITDLRSHKVAEIREQPRVEACWYLSATREQFRLRGKARLAGEHNEPDILQLRADIWDRIAPETRRLFVAPAPGTPLTENEPPRPPEKPPAHFALLMLLVDGVDHLELAGDPHRRTLFRRDSGTWQCRRLNP